MCFARSCSLVHFLCELGSLEDEILRNRYEKEQKHNTPQSEKQCMGFQRGHCKYGESCGFKHGDYCPKSRKQGDTEVALCEDDEDDEDNLIFLLFFVLDN